MRGRRGQHLSEYSVALGTVVMAMTLMRMPMTQALLNGLNSLTDQMVGGANYEEGTSTTDTESQTTETGGPDLIVTQTEDAAMGQSAVGTILAEDPGPWAVAVRAVPGASMPVASLFALTADGKIKFPDEEVLSELAPALTQAGHDPDDDDFDLTDPDVRAAVERAWTASDPTIRFVLGDQNENGANEVVVQWLNGVPVQVQFDPTRPAEPVSLITYELKIPQEGQTVGLVDPTNPESDVVYLNYDAATYSLSDGRAMLYDSTTKTWRWWNDTDDDSLVDSGEYTDVVTGNVLSLAPSKFGWDPEARHVKQLPQTADVWEESNGAQHLLTPNVPAVIIPRAHTTLAETAYNTISQQLQEPISQEITDRLSADPSLYWAPGGSQANWEHLKSELRSAGGEVTTTSQLAEFQVSLPEVLQNESHPLRSLLPYFMDEKHGIFAIPITDQSDRLTHVTIVNFTVEGAQADPLSLPSYEAVVVAADQWQGPLQEGPDGRPHPVQGPARQTFNEIELDAFHSIANPELKARVDQPSFRQELWNSMVAAWTTTPTDDGTSIAKGPATTATAALGGFGLTPVGLDWTPTNDKTPDGYYLREVGQAHAKLLALGPDVNYPNAAAELLSEWPSGSLLDHDARKQAGLPELPPNLLTTKDFEEVARVAGHIGRSTRWLMGHQVAIQVDPTQRLPRRATEQNALPCPVGQRCGQDAGDQAAIDQATVTTLTPP